MTFMGLKRLRGVVVGVCLSVGALAWGQPLQPPAKSEVQRVERKYGEAAAKQVQADAHPAVKHAPVAVGLEAEVKGDGSATGGQAERKKEQAVLDEGSKADWAMVSLTRYMMVVAIVQAGLFFWQLFVMHVALAHSATAAAAAAQSVRSMEESDRRAQRAYLCLERGGIEFPEPGRPVATVKVRNSGQTPAYDVRHWINLQVHGFPLRGELPRPPAAFGMGCAVLAPGGELIHVVDAPAPVCDHAHLPLIGTPHITIYVYGEVTYRDAFDRWHHTRYRLMHGGSTPAMPGVLRPCPEGNEAT